MKILIAPLSLILLPAMAQAALFVNVGNSAPAGEGPNGADTAYLAYDSGGQENANTGALQTFSSTLFTGLAGTYEVGVEFTYTNTTELAVRQSYGRGANSPTGVGTTAPLYDTFYTDWIGIDGRPSNGGNDGTSDTTIRLTFTGLAANTEFNLKSYHFDTNNQASSFTTSASGATVYSFGMHDGGDTAVDVTPFAYDFSITSDGAGTAFIDYNKSSTGGAFWGINGFDLTAVPEPSSTALIGLGGLALLMRRERRA